VVPQCFPSRLGCEKRNRCLYPACQLGSCVGNGSIMARRLLMSVLMVSALRFAQMPVPQLPQVYIDTTFNQPTGTTWQVHTSTDFGNALHSAHPGDTIVLDAGSNYTAY